MSPAADSVTHAPALCNRVTDVAAIVERAREAGRSWRSVPVAERLRIVRRARHAIAAAPETLAAACGRADLAESLAAEVLPLADACRFLERQAERILRPRRLGRGGRPVWLAGVSAELRREPFGTVLVIAPSNYPLMLPGIQALQALVAGNAVLLKPAEGHTRAATALERLLHEAGLPEWLLQLLPEETASVAAAVEARVDKVLLTGSVNSGRAVQRLLAERLVPATLELSGCDAAFVTRTADLDRAARCLSWGLCLNHSRTCIAPRRVFVEAGAAEELRRKLVAELQRRQARSDVSFPQTPAGVTAAQLVDEAVRAGARLLLDGISREQGQPCLMRPTLVEAATPQLSLLQADLFAPVLSLLEYREPAQAILWNEQCPYALGASLFSQDQHEIDYFTSRINAGCVVVNDLIAPTADPRIPFGGRRLSGYGVTRGAAGLEELTQWKVVLHRQRGWLPHLDSPLPEDAALLRQLIQTTHAASLWQRLQAAWQLCRTGLRRWRNSSR